MALPATAALALDGPLEVPYSDGGRAWFAAFEDDMSPIAPAPGEQRRLRSLAATVDAMDAALAALVARGGWSYGQLHLFGFSDGGTVRERTRACVLSLALLACFSAPVRCIRRGGSSMPPRRARRAPQTAGHSCGGGSDASAAAHP
jgi:hypothetical protein